MLKKKQICQIDREKTLNGKQFWSFLSRNMKSFRRKFIQFKQLPLVMVCETNSRFVGDTVKKYMIDENKYVNNPFGPIKFEYDDCIQRCGIVKTYQRTIDYVLGFDGVIHNRCLKIHDDVNTANLTVSLKNIIKRSHTELSGFLYPDQDTENPRLRKIKIGGKDGGQNDDLAIVWLMIVHFCKIRKRRLDGARTYLKLIHQKKRTRI